MSFFADKQILYVDSNLRASGNHTNFKYILDINQTIDYDSVALMDISIPKSMYTITNLNNTFIVDEITDIRVITIPVGNYNRQSFKNVLLPLLNESIYEYTITYDNSSKTQDDGKYVFTCNNILGSKFIFTQGELYHQMGFDKNSSNTFVNGQLTSSNVINFRTKSTYFLVSDICQNFNNSILQNIISTNTDDFNYINFTNENVNEYSKDYIRSKSNMYNFSLVDTAFQPIDLNNINITFTLLLFKRDNTNNLIKGYIKMKTLEMK